MPDRPGLVRSYRFKSAWRGATRRAVFARWGAACVICGDPGSDGKGKGLILGHLVADREGGTADESNLMPLCHVCSGRMDGGRRYD